MDQRQKTIVAWASLRAIYLYNSHRYEDSYAVSQEFLEWTSTYHVYPSGSKSLIINVPNFNKGNRTK